MTVNITVINFLTNLKKSLSQHAASQSVIFFLLYEMQKTYPVQPVPLLLDYSRCKVTKGGISRSTASELVDKLVSEEHHFN